MITNDLTRQTLGAGPDFHFSLTIGQKAEKEFETWILDHENIVSCRKMHHDQDFVDYDYEYDYEIVDEDENISTWEIKSLAGSKGEERYSNAVIEVWADDDRTRRPGWIRSVEAEALDYVCFQSRFDQTFYIFSATMLYNYVLNQTYMVRASGNINSPGWIVLVPWASSEAGYLRSS